MSESFEITVPYKGENLCFNARLMPYGYTHRIIVSVYGRDIVFEPDEERNYRAWVDGTATKIGNKEPDVGLLQAITETIEEILR
jgi:hypothetical protein